MPAFDDIDGLTRPPRPHLLGTGTTLFVNFDGIYLDACTPSDSRRNCAWYNLNRRFAPFSGTLQIKIGILQAMRNDVAPYGIRVTAVRPETGDYTMVVYSGSEEEFGMLGSAPAGDCDDVLPNQIVFAHVDGPLAGWVNGGATTALHEAAHSWGLDHTDAHGSVMFPAGNNGPTEFKNTCAATVRDTELVPGYAQCPGLNIEHCGDANLQNAHARLTRLFGPPYIDATPPTLRLLAPGRGSYLQAPATFDVVIEIEDDMHPQAYSVWTWTGDGPRPERPDVRVDPSFRVGDLPVGAWSFHVIVADEAGNESELEFYLDVGDTPPFGDGDGCACRHGRGLESGLLGMMMMFGFRRRSIRCAGVQNNPRADRI